MIGKLRKAIERKLSVQDVLSYSAIISNVYRTGFY